jgi:succinate dehydrogenase / fumarate reductase cytochrome b subunit
MGSVRFWTSTVGRKIVMGATGLVLVAFVVAHLAGNLLVYAGPVAENRYAAMLKSAPALLWTVRLVLLAATGLHIWAGLGLASLAAASRPVGYEQVVPQASTLASRTMRWGGIFLIAFLVLHLLHFTTGTIHPRFSPTDVFRNLVTGFQVWYAAALYLVAMAVLGLHLYHGASSLFQSLGLSHPQYDPIRRRVMRALAILIFGGFASIPAAVWLGLVR